MKRSMSPLFIVVLLTALCCVSPCQVDARNVELVEEQFDTIMDKLDEGGDLLVVANIDGLLEEGINRLIQLADLAPATDPSADTIKAIMAKLPGFLKKNGFYAVKGVGFSAVPMDDGLNKIKGFISRDAEAAKLPLWRGMFGFNRVEMEGLKYIPADTEFVRTCSGEPGQLWKIIRQAVTELGTPEAAMGFEQGLAMSTMMLGVPFDTLISSIGNEGFISIQLDKEKTIEVPVSGTGQTMSIPSPSLLIGMAIKDKTIPTLVETKLGGEGMPATKVESEDAEIFTINMPMPMPIPLQITFATQGSMFLLGSNPDVINRALSSAKSGKGLTASAKFKKAFGSLPMANNGLAYVSPRFTKTMIQVQEKMMTADSGGKDAEFNKALMTVFENKDPQQAAFVIINTKSGVRMVGKSTASGRYILASTAVAPMGMMAAVAIPSFVKAKETSQKNACINNLRQIDGAKDQWALENNKAEGEPVSPTDIIPYLMGGALPSCPGGGSYILHVVGENPTCSEPGHGLY